MGGPRIEIRMAERAEVLLAQHINEGLGVYIDPKRLRQFLCENWTTVQTLAHHIHDADVARKHAERRQELISQTGGL